MSETQKLRTLLEWQLLDWQERQREREQADRIEGVLGRLAEIEDRLRQAS